MNNFAELWRWFVVIKSQSAPHVVILTKQMTINLAGVLHWNRGPQITSKGDFLGYQWRQSCPINCANNKPLVVVGNFFIDRISMQSNIGLQHLLTKVCYEFGLCTFRYYRNVMKYNFDLLRLSWFSENLIWYKVYICLFMYCNFALWSFMWFNRLNRHWQSI